MNTTPKLRKEKQCDRKKSYPRRREAVRAMDRLHGYNNPAFNVYHCPHCFTWHVGHKIREELPENENVIKSNN